MIVAESTWSEDRNLPNGRTPHLQSRELGIEPSFDTVSKFGRRPIRSLHDDPVHSAV